jgi:hypothetical protein
VTLPTPPPATGRERGQAGQGREFPRRQGAQFGQVGEQGPADYRPDPLDRLQQPVPLPPRRGAADGRRHGPVDRRDLFPEPGEVGLDPVADGRRETRTGPVPLGHPHPEQLPATVQKCREFGPLGVGRGGRGWAGHGREVGQHGRIDRVGLGVPADPAANWRTRRGLTTAVGMPAASSAARASASYPPVASSTTSVGPRAKRRSINSAIPAGSFVTRNPPPGRAAASRWSLLTSIPAVMGSAMASPPRSHGGARSCESGLGGG